MTYYVKKKDLVYVWISLAIFIFSIYTNYNVYLRVVSKHGELGKEIYFDILSGLIVTATLLAGFVAAFVRYRFSRELDKTGKS